MLSVTLMPTLVSQRLPLETLSARFGHAELDQRHDQEHAEKDAKPDDAVALADETVHVLMLAGKHRARQLPCLANRVRPT